MLLTKQLLAFRPSKFDLIFACKTFFAGMVALYIAFSLDLPYPMWAIGTVFIIASPYSGMVSSKAIYRLIGTFAGASIAVFVTPYLINTPILFTFILALWTAFCLYVSMLDRTPRSYMFMLAGYTSVMVVCNAINSIETTSIFDIALGRVLEISIAVVVSAVVFSTIFPVHMGTAIQQRVNKALKDTELAFQQLFSPISPSNDSSSHSDEIVKLLSIINRDTNDIHGLAVHLAYEKGELKGMTKPLQEMLHQFSLVIMNMVAMSERLNQLDKIQPELRAALQPLAEISSAFIKQHYENGSQLTTLPHHIEQAFNAVEQNAHSTHAKVVLASLKMDLRHFIQNVSTVKLIWALIRQGEKKIPDAIAPLTTKYPSLHRDHGVALRGGLAAFVSVVVGFGLWIFSGWQYGYMMVQMAAVVACILTALDNPIPTLKVFLRGTLYATLIVFVYLFFILPDVKTFWQLALVLAPVMIYAVCLIPHPPLTGLGLPISINVIMALNLQNHYQVSPVPSIDAALAGLVGPIIPVLALYYIRAISPDMSAKRLLAAHYQAMQDAIHLPFGNQFKVHLRSMIDRIGLLNTKLVESAEIKQSMQDALVETSVSIDLARLSELAQHPNTPVTIRSDIHMVQQQLSVEFGLQEQNFTGQKQQQDQITQALNNLREHSLALEDRDLQQRLWMSINNIRYSICHEIYGVQADYQLTNHDKADAPNQPHQNTPKQNPPQGTAT